MATLTDNNDEQATDEYFDSLIAGKEAAAPAVAATPVAPAHAPDALESFGVGELRGMADLGNTLLNVLDYPAQELENLFGTMGGTSVAQNRAERDNALTDYEQIWGNQPAAIGGRVLGSIAATAPAMGAGGALPVVGRTIAGLRTAGTAGKIAANALTGAGAGAGSAALLSGGYKQPVGEQIAMGAGTGLVAGPILNPILQGAIPAVGRRVANALAGKQAPAQAADAALQAAGVDVATLPAEAQQNTLQTAVGQIKNGSTNHAALARKANLERFGLTSTEAMLTRDPLEWASERELAKRQPQLTETFNRNHDVVRGHLHETAVATGGSAQTPYDAGQSVIDAATEKWKELGKDAGKLYQEIRKTKGDDFGASPEKLVAAINEEIDSSDAEPIGLSVLKRMQRLGLVNLVKDENGKFSGQLAAAGPNSTRAMNVHQAEELRKYISVQGKGTAAGGHFRKLFVNALDSDVMDGAGDDAFKVARAAHRAKHEEFEASNLLDDIANDKVSPDHLIDNYIISSKGKNTAESLAAAKKSLLSGSKEQIARGTQAWNDLSEQVAETILRRATNGQADEGAVEFTPLKNVLAQIGPQKLRILFGDAGARRYADLLAAVRDSSFAPSLAPVNYSNTSNALTRAMELADKIPVVREVVSPVAGVISLGKKAMKEGAEQRAVQNALTGTGVKPRASGASNPLTDVLIPTANVPVNQAYKTNQERKQQ